MNVPIEDIRRVCDLLNEWYDTPAEKNVRAWLDAQPAAPEPGDVPVDVAKWIRAEANWCILSLAGDKSSEAMKQARATLAWLDAQHAAPEPDWTQAPRTVQCDYLPTGKVEFYTIDADGLEKWHHTKPTIKRNEWRSPYYRYGDAGCVYVDLPIGIDWRTTLRRRPPADDAEVCAYHAATGDWPNADDFDPYSTTVFTGGE